MGDDHTFERFGPYLIVRVLGTGGMGRIELALRADAPESEVCVLKRLLSYGRNDEQEARFRREAMIALRLSQENIAKTLRVEQIDDELCLAQEFVEGVNLSKVLRQRGRRPMPVAVAVHIVSEVAKGLAYAHEFQGHGIVHRDVTPENIMISFAGDVKIVDFGIARSDVDGTLTSLDTVVGRKSYIPPEAWSGKKVDRRADIYGLGVVLWELLAAQRAEETLEPSPEVSLPDLRRVDTAIPDELALIVKRALAPAEERFQSADEFRSALKPLGLMGSGQRDRVAAVLRDSFDVDGIKTIWSDDVADARRFLSPQKESTRGRSPGRSRALWIAAATAVIVVVAGFAWLLSRRGAALQSDALQNGPGTVAVAPVEEPRIAAAPVPKAPLITDDHANSGLPQPPPAAVAGRTPAVAAPRHALRPTAVSPDAEPRKTGAKDLLAQANELWIKGNVQGAMTRAHEAEAAGAGAPAHILLGMVLMNRQDFEAAEPELREALRLDPQNADAERLLALLRKSVAENKGK
jgi:serine/threonine protein kinase